jgi:hypothetical protein
MDLEQNLHLKHNKKGKYPLEDYPPFSKQLFHDFQFQD